MTLAELKVIVDRLVERGHGGATIVGRDRSRIKLVSLIENEDWAQSEYMQSKSTAVRLS